LRRRIVVCGAPTIAHEEQDYSMDLRVAKWADADRQAVLAVMARGRFAQDATAVSTPGINCLGPFPFASRHWRASSLPLSSGDFGGERVQLWLPKAPELRDPCVNRHKSGRINRIKPPLRDGPHPRKPTISQHFEML
jgi:hypothetical protein